MKIAAGLFLTAILAALAMSQVKQADRTGSANGATGQVERGKYIVEEVGKCEFCHTPRNERGQPDRGRWLMGGPVQIQPTYHTQWAVRAPRIAGHPPGTDADFIRLLTTGIAHTGQPPLPPMHEFHMTR